MSSQVQNDNSVDRVGDFAEDANAFSSSQIRKSKKKKKLGFFSFRSKKTKTINNNLVTTEQSDTLSVCSEISATEDGRYSSTTAWSEKTETILENVHRQTHVNTANQMRSNSNADSVIQKHDSLAETNGQTSVNDAEEIDSITSPDKTTEEDTITTVTPLAEEENLQPADNSNHQLLESDIASNQQPQRGRKEVNEGNNTTAGLQRTPEQEDKSVKGSIERPSSIRLQANGADIDAHKALKPQKSLAKRKQRIFTEQQSSSTDCSSYPVSPVKGRLKSKKVKMPSATGATHQLTVRLLSGQNLAARDSNGLSDPYVKFKIDRTTIHKSRICKATLNPKWGEEFTIPVKRTDKVSVRVFDRDIGMRDDFMGASALLLDSLPEDEEVEISLDLEDEDADEQEELGRIHVALTLVPIFDEDASLYMEYRVSPEDVPDNISISSLKVNDRYPISRSDSNASDISRRTLTSEMRSRKTKAPISTATIQLVSGKDLPARDSNGLSDPYVKFQMGKQRQKSKVCYKTLDPVWKEEFVFQLSGRDSLDREPAVLDITIWDKDSYRKDDFIGRCELDLTSLQYDKTHPFTLQLTDAPGSIMLLITLHSCRPSEIQPTNSQFIHLKERYSLWSTFSELSNIGFAEVKIIRADRCRAADIGGKSDPFCVVELCNARAQSHTCYKTLDPVWNKTVTFPVKDIHDVLNFTVYDEDKDGENDFLGRLAIPLLRATNGVTRTYALKDRKLLNRSKGTLTVQITFIYNPVRAAVRTFSPREQKFMEQDPRFKRHLLLRNFQRVWACIQAIIQVLEFINSSFTWQKPVRSATAFIVYLLIVWNIELYMLPILLLILLMKSYFDVVVQKTKIDRRLSINPDENFQDDDDLDDDIEDSNNKVSLLQRLKVIEEVLLKVQNILDWIACLLERIHNTFTWSVPFLSTLAVIVLSIAAVILYFIPLRTIALLWGINKFTKRLRKPNYIPNNELLDFLSRIPSEVELDEFQELTIAQTSPKGSKKKK